jgi:hypothetical protein
MNGFLSPDTNNANALILKRLPHPRQRFTFIYFNKKCTPFYGCELFVKIKLHLSCAERLFLQLSLLLSRLGHQ